MARGTRADLDRDRGRVAGDQAAADIGEGGDGRSPHSWRGKKARKRGLLVEAGEAGGAVAAGEGEVELPPPRPSAARRARQRSRLAPRAAGRVEVGPTRQTVR